MKKVLSRFLKKAFRFSKDMAKPFAYVLFASYNYYSRRHPDTHKLPLTVIGDGTKIHPKAFVAERGVIIGRDCMVDANAVVLEHSILEDGAIAMECSIIGFDGFVRLKVGKHITLRPFKGGVIIRNGAIVGPHCCVDRAFRKGNTTIGSNSVLGSNIHVAHDVQIEKECWIGTGAMLAGQIRIAESGVLGYDCSISNYLTVGEQAIVFPGSVVTKDVPPKAIVSGNFAMNHSKHRLVNGGTNSPAGDIL